MTVLRVLAVDDDRDTADTLGALLNHLGHEVSVHYDALSALEAVSSFRPHLVLLDLAMPDVDGCSLLRSLRETGAIEGTPAIAVTGFADGPHRKLAMDAGFNAFLVKPCRLADLQVLLSALVADPHEGS